MTMYNEAYDKDHHTVKQANKVVLDFVRSCLGYNNRSLKARLYREMFKNYFNEEVYNYVSCGDLNDALERIDYHFDEEDQYIVKTKQDGLDYYAIKLSEELDKDTCAYTIMSSLTDKNGDKVYLVQEHENRKPFDNFVIIDQSDDYGNGFENLFAVFCKPKTSDCYINVVLDLKSYEEAKATALNECIDMNKRWKSLLVR